MSKQLDGLKVALVIAPDQFRDEELTTPQQAFVSAGAEIKIASTRKGEAQGMLGATATVDTLISELNADNLNCVVVVGGMGSPEYLWDDKDLHTILKKIEAQDKVIGAICLSGAVLAKAGVLNGKRATVYSVPDSLKALSDGKATYVQEHVVQDGRVITADGPEAAPAFAEALVKELSKVKV